MATQEAYNLLVVALREGNKTGDQDYAMRFSKAFGEEMLSELKECENKSKESKEVLIKKCRQLLIGKEIAQVGKFAGKEGKCVYYKFIHAADKDEARRACTAIGTKCGLTAKKVLMKMYESVCANGIQGFAEMVPYEQVLCAHESGLVTGSVYLNTSDLESVAKMVIIKKLHNNDAAPDVVDQEALDELGYLNLLGALSYSSQLFDALCALFLLSLRHLGMTNKDVIEISVDNAVSAWNESYNVKNPTPVESLLARIKKVFDERPADVSTVNFELAAQSLIDTPLLGQNATKNLKEVTTILTEMVDTCKAPPTQKPM